ncbi:MAG: 16S rRNA (cytidine(1402)-2'-O)-methyltransferase, partial [Pseudobutyrivibrio sp.]|nr:16S rRNA (cytidine(1402)-2'-O)-methyltransferase [Pseudobutyrivibrio sp.]
KECRRVLDEIKNETRTIIIYEAPHHLIATLKELAETLGEDRGITLCRELTKKHEEKEKTTLGGALQAYETKEPRGEYVLVIAGKSKAEVIEEARAAFEEMTIQEHMDMYLNQGMDKKDAMKAVAKDRGVSKRDIYNALLD